TIFPILAAQISELAGRAGQVLANLSQIPENSLPFSDSINHSISQFLTSVNAQELVNQVDSNLQVFAQQLFALGGNLWQFIHVVSNGIVNLILVLILGFFMTVEKHAIENFVLSLFPVKHSEYAADRIVAMKKKIGHWLRAMLILMFAIGISVYIGLLILGVEYAAILAIIAGLLEVVPVLGPPLSLLLALPIVANQSGVLTLWVIGLYIVVQQLEGHILVPIIMKRVTGLSSIAVIFALLVGARFLGIVGIILSIPVATMLSMFLDDYLGKRKV
ncbi:MAG: AI-2E family transporter, partial [Bacteroidota bacterium]